MDMGIEAKLKDYIDNFYEEKDLLTMAKPIVFNTDNIQNDTPYYPDKYKDICNKILRLLDNIDLLDKYRIEVDYRCRFLTEKLLKTYVDSDSLVITSNSDHNTTLDLLNSYNTCIIDRNKIKDNQELVIENIVTEFKNGHYKKLFFIMVSTVSQLCVSIDEGFFAKLKAVLVKEQIPHIMVLDSCQDIFIIKKNYEVFDAFLATSHVLSCLLPKVGLLFTKLPKRVGFVNTEILNLIYPKLEIINKYKDKAIIFNNLMYEYFKPTMERLNFNIFENETPHQFSIALPNTIIQDKWDIQFAPYNIRFNPINSNFNFVRLRYHELIIQDSSKLLEALKSLKSILKQIHFHQQYDINKVYDNKKRDLNKYFKPLANLSPKIKILLNSKQILLIQQMFMTDHNQKVR